MQIYLVRHGETEWNRIHRFQGRSDVPMNREGEKQARALAKALKDKPFAAIYTSPLIRAVETASIIKEYHHSVHMITEEGFIEMNLGDFDGMDARSWAAQYPEFQSVWQKHPASVEIPGGESLKQVQARALDTLERITRNHPADAVLLICSHNFVILTILCHVMEIPLDRFRELKQDNAAFSVLDKRGSRFRAELVNERSHLDKNLE
jgi:probable phosphoglycerate mutase